MNGISFSAANTAGRLNPDLAGEADALSLLRALGEVFDNPDSDREDAALAAARAGRPAWWTICDYNNQSALLVCQYANTHGLGFALARFSDDTWPSAGRHAAYLAAMMVPLNQPARAEYSRVMARIAGGVR